MGRASVCATAKLVDWMISFSSACVIVKTVSPPSIGRLGKASLPRPWMEYSLIPPVMVTKYLSSERKVMSQSGKLRTMANTFCALRMTAPSDRP